MSKLLCAIVQIEWQALLHKNQNHLPTRYSHGYQAKDMQITRIMIVDDHPLVRTGFRQLIESEPDLGVCCEAANIAEAIHYIKGRQARSGDCRPLIARRKWAGSDQAHAGEIS